MEKVKFSEIKIWDSFKEGRSIKKSNPLFPRIENKHR